MRTKDFEEKVVPDLKRAVESDAKGLGEVVKSYYGASYARVVVPKADGGFWDLRASYDNNHVNGSVNDADFVLSGMVSVHYADGMFESFCFQRGAAEMIENLASRLALARIDKFLGLGELD